MKVAIMQPYIFPYLGYYQLVNAVDTFVFFDDVNFIMKGWINRNQILQQHEAYRFTLPLNKASQNKLINEIEIANYEKWRTDFLKLMEFNYKKAPQFNFFYGWLKDFLFEKTYTCISDLAAGSIQHTARLIGLETNFLFSSKLNYHSNEHKNGQDKILSICKLLGARTYINPKNGVELYEAEKFNEANVALHFINMNEIVYPQFRKDEFVPYLSILDILMFNDTQQVKTFMNQYTLI